MGKNFSGGAIAGIAIAGIVGLFIGYIGVKKALVNNTENTISVFVKNNNAGIIKNPPPAPKKPVTIPTKAPINITRQPLGVLVAATG